MSTSNATSTADWEKARARRKSGKKAVDDEPAPVDDDDVEKVIAQFVSSEGEEAGPQVYLPLNTTPEQLEALINDILSNDEPLPYTFQLNHEDVNENLGATISQLAHSKEHVVRITFLPMAVFRIRPVTRCTSSMPGHQEAVLSVSFSPDGKWLASGSGDTTVRVWDVLTQTPYKTCTGHKNWVLCVAWSQDCEFIASGSMDNDVRIWDPMSGHCLKTLKGHTKYVIGLAWEPMHKNPKSTRLASCSKDGTVRVWDVRRGVCLYTLSGHTMSVTCVKWSGEGSIITASQDRTIKVYNADRGILFRTLKGHGHWVNTMALNTDYVLRTGAYDHTGTTYEDLEERQRVAQRRYDEAKGSQPERLATGSDDFTIFLWEPAVNNKPLTRMTGHQQPINLLSYSPDGRLLASASFDKSLKLWNGQTGKFISTLRGHVGAVYQVCWSADSRMIVSGSSDSTLKVWDLRTNKLKLDLPGHADEVFSVDWSPDGERVASGAKDKVVKIWQS